jgi:hypothetical protein
VGNDVSDNGFPFVVSDGDVSNDSFDVEENRRGDSGFVGPVIQASDGTIHREGIDEVFDGGKILFVGRGGIIDCGKSSGGMVIVEVGSLGPSLVWTFFEGNEKGKVFGIQFACDNTGDRRRIDPREVLLDKGEGVCTGWGCICRRGGRRCIGDAGDGRFEGVDEVANAVGEAEDVVAALVESGSDFVYGVLRFLGIALELCHDVIQVFRVLVLLDRSFGVIWDDDRLLLLAGVLALGRRRGLVG